jgi:fission process protein 1
VYSAPPSTDSDLRYAAYASRARTILLSAHRYVAYTSDIGESFRPMAHPYLIRGAYGISWLYLIGDVSHEGYKAYIRNQKVLFPSSEDHVDGAPQGPTPPGSTTLAAAVQDLPKPGKVDLIDDYRTVAVQRAIFQSVASMGLPAFTIHSVVKYSGKALKNAANKNIRTWAPVGLGLAAVPALPFMFDEPVEHAVEWIFHKALGPGQASGGHAIAESKKEL